MHPDLVITPGEVLLEEFLKPHSLTPSRLADRLGLPPNRITAIVNGKRAITPETAVLFGTVFGTTPQFWLNLQRRFDLQTALVPEQRLQRAPDLHKEISA